MKRKLVLVFTMAFAALVSGSGYLALQGSGGDQGSFMPGGIALARPAIAQEDSTFPADEAGIAAYVRVPGLDIVKAAEAFDTIYELGDHWAVGGVLVQVRDSDLWECCARNPMDVRVYLASPGWVVAYLPKNVPPASIMVWPGIDLDNPVLGPIQDTALDLALNKIVAVAGIDFALIRDQVGYYHFQYPNANKIFLAAKAGTGPGQPGGVRIDLAVPTGSTVFSESISMVSSSALPQVRIGSGGVVRTDLCNFPIEVDVPMDVGVGYWYVVGRCSSSNYIFVAGLAIVIVYQTPQA